MKGTANILMLVICFCCSFLVHSQVQKDSIIIWQQEYKLKWDDFQGSPPSSDKIGLGKAGTASGIYLKSDFYDGNIPHFIVLAKFNKKDSWTILKDYTLLMHEQTHFDITELFARKIRKCFSEMQAAGETDTDAYVKAYYKLDAAKDAFQGKYDRETQFIPDSNEQLQWIESVHKELRELKEWESPPIE